MPTPSHPPRHGLRCGTGGNVLFLKIANDTRDFGVEHSPGNQRGRGTRPQARCGPAGNIRFWAGPGSWSARLATFSRVGVRMRSAGSLVSRRASMPGLGDAWRASQTSQTGGIIGQRQARGATWFAFFPSPIKKLSGLMSRWMNDLECTNSMRLHTPRLERQIEPRQILRANN